MSNASVDERIVRMQFDNAQFEERARNTIATLGSLSSALQLPTGSQGFDKIQGALRRLDFSPLSSAIDVVGYRFSSLGAMAINAFTRIENAAINAGKTLATAVTITPAKEGFSEYELKMESVKRILNSAKDSEGLPVTLSQVNAKLDELNHYADKTIYSFSDMTTNIGKFTNAGVDLDKSVAAIQGIANEAALAGANSQEASRAMYNFAQALSAGYVKLIDWKSIENANMATVGFKEQLIQTAYELGNLKKEGDKYITTTKDMNGKVSEAFDATTLFNESLGHQWMTSEVLTQTLAKYADETTEIGRAAAKAATEVTTFHKLLDTLKEALGSGWAQTWEIIFGDFEESKKLWTGINDVLSNLINTSADARNNLFQGWVDLGGRVAAIQGLKDVWGGVVNIVREAGWAFDKVLPKIDAFDLTRWSVNIREFGKNFRMFTGRESSNINKTFQGIAAAADLLGQALSAVGRSLAPLLTPLGELTHYAFSASGSFGEWLANLAATARETDFFYTKIQSVITFFKNVGDTIEGVVRKVRKLLGIESELTNSPVEEKMARWGDSGKSPIERAASAFDRLRTSITNFIDSVKNSSGFALLTTGLTNLVTALGNFAKTVGGALISGIEQLADGLGKLFSKSEDGSGGMLDLLNVGLLGGIALAFKKLYDGLKNPFKGIFKLFDDAKSLKEVAENLSEGISDFFENITEPIKAFTASVEATTLIKIAAAIGILAASALLLASIDSAKLTQALLGLGGIMIELSLVTKALSKITEDGKSKGLSSIGAYLVAFAAAIGILSLAVGHLAKVEPDGLRNGILAIGALMLFGTLVSKFGGKQFSAKGLISMSVAILIMQVAIRRLAEIDADSLANGVLAVGVLMALMTVMSKLGGKNFSGKSMVAMAGAVRILQQVVVEFGNMDTTKMRNGLIAVGVLMTLMTLMSRLGGKKIGTVGLVIIAAAVLILQKITKDFSEMDVTKMRNGLIAVGVLMTLMTLMSQLGGKKAGVLTMLAIAASVKILQRVVEAFASMNVDDLLNGVLAVGALMSLMAIMSHLGKSNIGSAVGMLVMAAALNVLVPVIKTLGTLPFTAILTGLGALALTFGLLFVAGSALAPVVPILLGLSGAFVLIGVGVTALGVGITILSGSLAAFTGAFILRIDMVVDAFFRLLKKIGDNASTLVQVVVQIGSAIIDGIVALYPKLSEAIILLLLSVMQLITQYGPVLTNAFVNMVITIIDGIALAIYNNTDKFIMACRHVLGAVIDFILATLQELLRGLPGIGGKIEAEIGKVRDSIKKDMNAETGAATGAEYAQGIANGATSLESTLSGAGTSIGDTLKTGATGALSSLSPEIQEILAAQLSGGIDGAQPDAEADAAGLGDGVMSSLLTGLSGSEDIGSYIAEGLGNGLTDNAGIPQEAAELLGSGTLDGLNGILEVNSPSRKTWETGMNLDQGLANGVTENQGLITTALSGLGGLFDNILSALTPKFSNAGANSGSAFGRGIASGVGASRSAGTTLVTTASSALSTSVARFRQNGILGGSSYASGVRSKEGEAKSAGVRVGANAVTGLGTAKTSFISVGMTSGSSYASGVSSRQGAARSAGSNIGNSALSGLRSVGGWYGVGEDSSEGYLDGLMSKASSIARGAARIVSDAISAARNAIDSHSPSREWMKLGVDSDEGYILGTESKAGEVNETMAKLAVGAMAAFYDGISRANMLANSDLLVTPTVSPVFDTSSAYGDLDYLSGLFDGTGGVLGSISTSIDGHVEELNQLIANTNKIITVLQGARPIIIDGATVIGWVDRELGALG